MGYTRSFTLQPGSAAYAAAWPQMLADTELILQTVSRRGIALCGPLGTGKPQLDPAVGIGFNGNLDSGHGCDSLWLPAPGPVAAGAPDDARVWRYTKTIGLPYDLAVTSVLLRCHLLAPDAFTIGGSGTWHDWTTPVGHNPRDLVTDLFGTHVADSPLVDTTEGFALTQSGGWVDPRLATEPIVVTRPPR
ncbi:hypothetical protein [Catellatospora paridis]|uniref:hypothetical protein n=1 Tax=Catellatospora paridis TaxID=1617086 RepID=UPI0012D3E549|nr:hypothetical protein [Catellatospora paridis]